jgi:hypothetical protein
VSNIEQPSGTICAIRQWHLNPDQDAAVDSVAHRDVPLTSAGIVHTGMKVAGQRLLNALGEQDRLYRPDLPDEDFEEWKAAREVVEPLATDYIAMVHLYLEAVRMDVRKYLN